MPPDLPPADWRDPARYAPLLRAESWALAWEWLRRHPGYRAAAVPGRARAEGSGGPAMLEPDEAAARWGLHAFEDPALAVPLARPLWRAEQHSRVLAVAAATPNGAADCFELERFACLSTIAADARAEHLLISDGVRGVRLDVLEGTLLRGPRRLAWRPSGLKELDSQLGAAGDLLRLWKTGSFGPPCAGPRNVRIVLLLRAWDALAAGANQRDIAQLLSRERLPGRWRSEVPSLRSRAQRLVRGARAMARGGYRALLAG